jgi:hypothetical protein
VQPALALTFGYADGSLNVLAGQGRDLVMRDVYTLPEIDLGTFDALLISMHSDQRFLATRARQIEAYLTGGGTVVANGHFAYPFLPRMRGFHAIDNYKIDDIKVLRLEDHPIWHGVAADDLTFRRGVAGFYGRVWHEAPPDAQVIHALGRADRPLDFVYPVGRGRVLFHGGNDLWQFGGGNQLVPQLWRWIAKEAAPREAPR